MPFVQPVMQAVSLDNLPVKDQSNFIAKMASDLASYESSLRIKLEILAAITAPIKLYNKTVGYQIQSHFASLVSLMDPEQLR